MLIQNNQFCINLGVVVLILLIVGWVVGTIFFILRNARQFKKYTDSWKQESEIDYTQAHNIGDDGEISYYPPPIKSKKPKKKRDEEYRDRPNRFGFLTQQLFIALIGLLGAVITFLASTSPLVTVAFHTTCIQINYLPPTPGPIYTATSSSTAETTLTPVSTVPPTATSSFTPTTQPTNTPTATSTWTPTTFPTNTFTATPTVTESTTLTPTPAPRFYPLPLLDGLFWPSGYNVGRRVNVDEVSLQQIFEIPFEIGRQINTQGCPNQQNLDEYVLPTSLFNPINVYFLIQAGNGLIQYQNDVIGRIELQFSNGAIFSEDLILGFNIRDWVRDKPDSIAVMTVSSSTVREAWRGQAAEPDGPWIGGIDMLTIQVPPEYRGLQLVSVKLLDTTQANNGTNAPCIHLQAVTVEVD